MAALLASFRQGLRLPPSGWGLAGLLVLFVLAGLIGRDPWKGEDAIHIAATWNILAHQDWLTPELAGRAFHEPPLYYWSAALTGKLLGWLLPLHDAIRFASGIWVALALVALYYAGRELYGQERAAASPLLLAGCAGLAVNAHEAQPLLIALAAYCGTLAAVTAFQRRPRLSGVYYGLSLTGCLLGCGIAPLLPLIVAGPLAITLLHEDRRAWRACLLGWAVFALLAAPWPIALSILEPARLHGWLNAEIAQLTAGAPLLRGLGGYLTLLPFAAFPTVFIAGWTLWRNRRQPICRETCLPLTLFGLTLLMLLFAYRPKELTALLLLPPLALLATPGALALRRGADSALNWFAMLGCGFFMALVWVGWSALAFGWPEKLAQRALILRPGFVHQIEFWAVLAATAGTFAWLWLIATSRRSPYRSLLHWSMGITTLWFLAAQLWMPWFNYGKSYRPVFESAARHLPRNAGCLTEIGMEDSQRASLSFFTGLEPRPYRPGSACRWLLAQESPGQAASAGEGWEKVWQGNRPGDRRERFVLYRR